MPLKAIESLSRLAGSPALPTAITTRPQLASSPAIAVFTSGEFATDIAIFRAEAFETAPSTMISTSLRAPSPSRATCSDRSASTSRKALAKAFRRGSLARLIFGAPFAAAAPVAKASSVSEVEVSPSIVMALKVSSTPLLRSDCSAVAEHTVELAGIERLADYAGGSQKNLVRAAGGGLGGDRRRQRGRLPPSLA